MPCLHSAPRSTARDQLVPPSCPRVQIETKLATAMIVARFRVAADAERFGYKTVDDFAAACTALITLKHPGGVHLSLTPRVASSAPVPAK